MRRPAFAFSGVRCNVRFELLLLLSLKGEIKASGAIPSSILEPRRGNHSDETYLPFESASAIISR